MILRIQRLHWFYRFGVLILIFYVLSSLISFGLVYRRAPGEWHAESIVLVPAALICVGGLLFIRVLYPMVLKRNYNRNPALHREIRVDFDEERVRSNDGAGGTSDSPWSHFDCFSEGSRAFVIRTPGNVYSIISKSQMTTEELAFLRAVLRNNLKKK